MPLDREGSGDLWILQHEYVQDWRQFSWAPPVGTETVPLNCYLICEQDAGLLVDTGMTTHRADLLAQLDDLLPAGARLSILPTTIGEFGPLCNVRAIIDRYDVTMLYGALGDPVEWMDFQPDSTPFGTPPRHGVMRDLPASVTSGDATLAVDVSGERVLESHSAPLQLLPFRWTFDRSTGAMLTADSFTYVRRPDPSGEWIVRDADGLPSDDEVYAFLTGTRFWWLPGAKTERIIDGIDELFTSRDVEAILPAYGCPIVGRDAVAAAHAQLVRVLRRAANDEPVGLDRGRWAA